MVAVNKEGNWTRISEGLRYLYVNSNNCNNVGTSSIPEVGLAGVWHAFSLSTHGVGHALAQAEANDPRHAIKQVDCFFGERQFLALGHVRAMGGVSGSRTRPDPGLPCFSLPLCVAGRGRQAVWA